MKEAYFHLATSIQHVDSENSVNGERNIVVDFRHLVRRQKNDMILFLGGQFVKECAYSIEQYYGQRPSSVNNALKSYNSFISSATIF